MFQQTKYQSDLMFYVIWSVRHFSYIWKYGEIVQLKWYIKQSIICILMHITITEIVHLIPKNNYSVTVSYVQEFATPDCRLWIKKQKIQKIFLFVYTQLRYYSQMWWYNARKCSSPVVYQSYLLLWTSIRCP